MKKIKLEEQDDGKTIRCRIKEGKEVVTVRYFRKDMVDSIIKKSKIEVFDEMENTKLKLRYKIRKASKLFDMKGYKIEVNDNLFTLEEYLIPTVDLLCSHNMQKDEQKQPLTKSFD